MKQLKASRKNSVIQAFFRRCLRPFLCCFATDGKKGPPEARNNRFRRLFVSFLPGLKSVTGGVNDKMQKGKIIYLSGVTSTGKTSIARAIQEMSDDFSYLVSTDNLRNMVSRKYLIEDFFNYEFKLYIDMYHVAKLLSDMGNNVILDGVLFETPRLTEHYLKIRHILKNNPLLTVEVICPLEICRQRNIERGDRGEFQSAEQDEMADKSSVLDFSVRTDVNSPEECAEMILRKAAETLRQ